MKNLPLLFFGIFFFLAFSWWGIIFVGQRSPNLGGLQPATETLVDAEGNPVGGTEGFNNPDMTAYPLALVGSAQRGKEVYISMGCVYCHSQQVRRKGIGSDFERGWGDRQTVARDYIQQERVMLGTMRTGPDLMNVGQRIPTADWHHLHLYNPRTTSPGSYMPPFAFLYDLREIGDTGPSPEALNLGGEFAPPPGYEVVPKQEANDLVAYLLSLKLDYDLPEIKREE